jgi:hypothetical protein
LGEFLDLLKSYPQLDQSYPQGGTHIPFLEYKFWISNRNKGGLHNHTLETSCLKKSLHVFRGEDRNKARGQLLLTQVVHEQVVVVAKGLNL